MIVQRLVSGVVTVAVLATAAIVAIVAAAFAVFTLLSSYVGPSVASAIIAAVLALALFGIGFTISGKAKLANKKTAAEPPVAEQSLPQRLFYMMRDRPIIAAGAAASIGLLAWRNPRLVGTAMSLFALTRERS